MQPIGFAPDERSLVVHHVTRGQVTRGQMSLWSNVMQPLHPHIQTSNPCIFVSLSIIVTFLFVVFFWSIQLWLRSATEQVKLQKKLSTSLHADTLQNVTVSQVHSVN
jgi:hypothetical protein